MTATGAILNGIYYNLYFLSAAYPKLLSLFMAMAFIAFELLLWFYTGKSWLNILKISMVVFSVAVTMASQYEATSEKETQITSQVFEVKDFSGDIEYYRERIKQLDDRIDEYISQNKVFGTARLKEEREAAEAEKAEIIKKLDELMSRKDTEVEHTIKVSTVYNWFAEDLPLIFKGEINANFIRIIFQLFSSVILALLAPVSLTLIRRRQSDIGIPTSLSAYMPDNQPMAKHDKAQILKMLTYYMPSGGELMSPEKAVDEFARIHKAKESVKDYSIEECMEVYNEIFSRGLQDKTAEEIKKGVLM